MALSWPVVAPKMSVSPQGIAKNQRVQTTSVPSNRKEKSVSSRPYLAAVLQNVQAHKSVSAVNVSVAKTTRIVQPLKTVSVALVQRKPLEAVAHCVQPAKSV